MVMGYVVTLDPNAYDLLIASGEISLITTKCGRDMDMMGESLPEADTLF